MNVNFPWKGPVISMNYFERVFQEFLSQIKKHLLHRIHVLQNSHFWTKLPLAACWTFFFSKLVCTLLLIFHGMIQSLKESFFQIFQFGFSIFNVEFTFFSWLQVFPKCSCISNFLGNHFLTLWTLFIAEFM